MTNNIRIPTDKIANGVKRPPEEPALVKNRRTLYRGPQFSFVAESVKLPNGHTADLSFVDHPGSTAVVPLLDERHVLLLRQYRHPVGGFLYEIPAGTLETEESFEECARRELIEETGYAANEMRFLARIHILPAYSSEQIHVFLATSLEKSVQALDAEEVIEVVPFEFNAAMDLIEQGRMTDALSILALYRADRYLHS